MDYIIAGANLANARAPSVSYRARTASDTLEKVEELERRGYHVRVSSSEGDEVTIATIKARVVLEEEEH